MDNIEDKIKQLIIVRYKSVTAFAREFKIPSTSVFAILQRGIGNSSFVNVQKICDALNIDIEYLSKGEIREKEDSDKLEIPEEEMLLACHFTGKEYTEEELNEIQQFADFVKNRRR